MQNDTASLLVNQLDQFRLPRYAELPAIELYLDQLIQIVENCLNPVLAEDSTKWLTTAMVNNYTKQGLIKRPKSKKYDREHIAYLLFICVAKTVLPISKIQKLTLVQQAVYSVPVAYDYFCTEFENALHNVFSGLSPIADTTPCPNESTYVLRALAISAAYQIHLNNYLDMVEQKVLLGSDSPQE